MSGAMLFPLSYLAMTSAVTVLLIVLGLAGRAELSAEVAVIQGALLATFYAFSANTRALILQQHGELTPARLLAKRVVTLPLLAIGSWLLCASAGVSPLLSLLLIGRRAAEWLSEVRVCEMEVAGDAEGARRVLVMQGAVFVATAAGVLYAPALWHVFLVLFAISPLVGATPRIKGSALTFAELRRTFHGVSPHIGSTVIVGASIYVTRLLVFLLAGATIAGYLFTAFALGSFLATLFGNVVGPTMVLQRSRGTHGRLVRWVRRAMLGMGLAGAAVTLAIVAAGVARDALGRPGYFWLAVGLSLVGGAAMVVAQTVRLRLFAQDSADVLFGPDVLRNLALILAVPLLYRLISPSALSAIYLFDALLTLAFYFGARRDVAPTGQRSPWPWLSIVMGVGVLFPLFFVLGGRIYRRAGEPLLDSGGSVMDVPLPVSLLVLFAGLVAVARYRRSVVSLGTIFFLFVGMVLTSAIVSSGNVALDSRKFVLLFQFLVPVFALALGQMIGQEERILRRLAWGFLIVLAIVVPPQLLRSIGYAHNELHHDLWLFSIYQSRQFVPVVFVAAYVLCLASLWDDRRARAVLVLLAPLHAYYVMASYSTLSLLLELLGLAMLLSFRPRSRMGWALAASMVCVSIGYVLWNSDRPPMRDKLAMASELTKGIAGQSSGGGSIGGRLQDWTLHARGIVEAPAATLFGHAQALDRSVSTSAHNYYLDFVYNFGLMAFLPIAWLIAYTLLLLWRARKSVMDEPALAGLALVSLYAIFVDNSFKVVFRQPYPGIFYFLLWGLLISHLRRQSPVPAASQSDWQKREIDPAPAGRLNPSGG